MNVWMRSCFQGFYTPERWLPLHVTQRPLLNFHSTFSFHYRRKREAKKTLRCTWYDRDAHRATAVSVSPTSVSLRVIQNMGTCKNKSPRGQRCALREVAVAQGDPTAPRKCRWKDGDKATWKWEDVSSEQQLLWNRVASTPTLLKASKPCVTANVLNHMLKCQTIPLSI